MQMHTETIQTPTAAQFDARIDAARAALAKLQEAADECEAEARRWSIAFEREPTSESHQNAMIWGQKAKNALQAVEDHELQVVWQLEAEKKGAEYAAAKRALESQVEAIEASMTTASDAFVTAAQQLDVGLRAFERLGELRSAAMAIGYHPPPLHFYTFIEAFNARLNKALPSDRRYPHTTRTHVAFSSSSGPDPLVKVEINRPASMVPGVFR